MSVKHRARTGDIIGILFSGFSNMKVCCVFSLGDSNEYTQHTIINAKRQSPDIIPNIIMSAAMDYF